MRQYSRQIDQALRPLLSGLDLPLILAATEPMESIYRSVNTYPNLLAVGVPGNPDAASDAGSPRARGACSTISTRRGCARSRRGTRSSPRNGERRPTSPTSRVPPRNGLVDTVLVDIDDSVPGQVEDETGAVTFDEADDAVNYGVVDEIARRVWLNGGSVLAVRRADIPGNGSLAALLRYAP